MATLMFFNVPAAGHVNPSLGVIAELVRRGHQVIYYNADDQRVKIERTGAEFRAYPPLPAYNALVAQLGRGNFAHNALELMLMGEGLLPRVLEDVKRDRPDGILYDQLASWGRWASELTGIPGISSVTTFVLTPSNMPPLPVIQVGRMLFNMVKLTPRYMRQRSRLHGKGITDAGWFKALMSTAPLNLVFTSRQFQPKSESLGPEFVFVGASVAERPDTLDIPLDGRPLVYVSLGTLHVASAGFVKTVFEAFKDMAAQVIVSTGGKTPDPAALGPVPDNVTVRPYVAQLEVLKRAAAFVTHGGMNSVHEGLLFGVPMVVVPQQMEQLIVAQQTERHGAGVLLAHPGDPAAMRAAVERVLSAPSYKHASAALGQSMRDAGGETAAADAIDAYIAGKR